MSKEGIYRFVWDIRRMGELEGLFAATDEDVKNAINKDVYFGEVLGKHSDIGGTLEEEDIKLVTEDPVAVDVFKEHALYCGYNPLHYLHEEEE